MAVSNIETLSQLKNSRLSIDGNKQLWLSLLLCDSGFPGGSFSHSQGIESAYYHGHISKDNKSSLEIYLNLLLEQTMSMSLSFVSQCHERSFDISNDKIAIDEWLQLICSSDSDCHNMLTNETSRKASISQGRCLLKVVHEVFGENDPRYSLLSASLCRHDGTSTYHHQPPQQPQQPKQEMLSVLLPSDTSTSANTSQSSSSSTMNTIYRGHYAPLFGTICGLLDINLEFTKIMFLRCVLRDALSAACRLNLLGPIEGAKLQLKFSYHIEYLLQNSQIETISVSNSSGSCISFINSDCTNNQVHDSGMPTQAAAIITKEMRQYLKPSNIAYLEKYNDNKRRKIETMTTVAPILDLLQSQHEQLYSRLFIS